LVLEGRQVTAQQTPLLAQIQYLVQLQQQAVAMALLLVIPEFLVVLVAQVVAVVLVAVAVAALLVLEEPEHQVKETLAEVLIRLAAERHLLEAVAVQEP
jgi:hypothetical protein